MSKSRKANIFIIHQLLFPIRYLVKFHLVVNFEYKKLINLMIESCYDNIYDTVLLIIITITIIIVILLPTQLDLT